MVDIKELRIGNIVVGKYSSIIQSVNSIVKDDGYSGGYCIHLLNGDKFGADCIEPIPLTEELLLKCGFTKEYYGFSCDIVELSYGRFLCNDDTDKDKLFLSINNAEYTISGVSLKYLHQLQNIYYDLTGKELDVKL